MFTIECPFCDEPVRMVANAESVRCEACSVELEFAADVATPAVGMAA
jgi:primosomal protein N'